jgi:peptidoglycan/LPS O-acetylase OafA/YrhL
MNKNGSGSSLAQNQFRPEIAGLRAVAVFSVILCHLKVPYFEGGFVGVDVFFVISGYLISKHILADLARGTFKLSAFYLRRTRRILPALIVTLFISFLVGAMWLDPQSFRGLAKETTHALLSIANIQYWREAHEYFAPAAENLPLLHTWSLSVEEQFYLFWPAFLLLIHRRIPISIAVIVLATLSLFSCMVMLRYNSQASFFLTPFRVFEFCVGAGCAFHEKQLRQYGPPSAALTVSGLVAIALSVISFSPQTSLPGIGSLLPCLGAASVILGGSASMSAKPVTNPVAQYLGLISYSLYLCHWPILYFVRYVFGPAADSSAAKLAMITAMVVMASGMQRFVERPFLAYAPERSTGSSVQRFAIVIGIFAAVTHTTFLQNGWAWRLSPHDRELADRQSFGVHPCKGRVLERCEFGADGGQRSVEIIGDSFSHHYVSGLNAFLKPMGLSGAVTIIGGCPMLLGLRSINPGADICKKAQHDVFEQMSHTPASVGVMLAQSWGMYTDEFTMTENERTPSPSHGISKLEDAVKRTVAFLSQNGRRVMIIGSQVSPACPIDKSRMFRGPLWRAPPGHCPPEAKTEVVERGLEINRMLERIIETMPPNVSLLKPSDHFCDETLCPIIKHGEWLFIDQGHFSVAGSHYMVKRSTNAFKDLIRPQATSLR